jgi:hypothetical protein
MQSEWEYAVSAGEPGPVPISGQPFDPKGAIPRVDLPKRMIDHDGTPVDVFPLPIDSASLESLLRDLFENHWREIVFGPVMPGAAWEMRAEAAPKISLFDGYLTVAFGVPHFHICIGETKGPRIQPTPPEVAADRRTARAELYRTRRRSCVPMSWGLRLYNRRGDQQITIFLPNPFLEPETDRFVAEPDWSRLALWDKLRARWFGLTESDPVDRSANRPSRQ